MSKAGIQCPRCGGQCLRDSQDIDTLSCVQCGHIVYSEAPAVYEPDRRSRTDNRQVTPPFGEYRQAMTDEEFEEEFSEIISEEWS